jgi:hypothetical protein
MRRDTCLGQLGHGARGPASRRARRVAVGPAFEVVAGQNFTCARTRGGVYCWGSLGCEPRSSPLYGGLDGIPPPPPVTVLSRPSRIAVIGDAVSITAAGTTACALTTTGSVQCWGCQEGRAPTEVVERDPGAP